VIESSIVLHERIPTIFKVSHLGALLGHTANPDQLQKRAS